MGHAEPFHIPRKCHVMPSHRTPHGPPVDTVECGVRPRSFSHLAHERLKDFPPVGKVVRKPIGVPILDAVLASQKFA